ncbi:MAG: carboxypeptidase regulatory-like domain-containing protein [Bryobacteraceae bacterium]
MRRSVLVLVLLFFAAASGWTQLISAPAIPMDGQAGQVSTPQPTVPFEQRCVAAGRITNALTGEPLRKATVRLSASRGGSGMEGSGIGTLGDPRRSAPGGQGYSTSTDTDGSFRIEGVNPGGYTLVATRTGFLSASYGAKSPNGSGSVIQLAPAQQKTDLSVAMTPQAVITGKVIDPDGDPVSGGMVQVLAPMWMRGKLRYSPRGANQINDLGEYRIPNLGPGKYYIFAQVHTNLPAGNASTDKADIRPVRTFYPSSVAFGGATPVEITAGQDASGIDIRIQSAPTFHVRGRISGIASEGGRARSMVSITPRDEEMIIFSSGQSTLRDDGSFDIAGVAPGAYYLNMFSMSGQIRSIGRQAIDVGAGNVDGIVLPLTPPASIKGVARIEGTPPANMAQLSASNLHLSLMPAETTGMMGPPANAKFSADGTFSLENVAPGKFYLQTNALPGTYLKSVRFGNSEILGKEIDLTGGAAGELELIYRYGPGEIDGQLDSTRSGSSADGGIVAQIAVVPEELNADGSGVRFLATDTKGTFSITSLPPGRYRTYAFEEANLGALQNPDLLKQLETKSPLIEVKENEKKLVQLPLIPRDELNQIYTRLGVPGQ